MKTKALLLFSLLLFVMPFSNGQNFPKIDESIRIKKLEPPKGKVRMVLDTDTYNEMDDQFASLLCISVEREAATRSRLRCSLLQ